MNIVSAIIERIRAWYRGCYVPPRRPDPEDLVVRVSGGHYEQPLPARILRWISRWTAAYWQWLIPILIMLLALLVNAVNLFLQCRHAV